MVTFDDRWDGALQESGALVTPTGRTPAPRQVLKTRKRRNVTLASAIIMFIHFSSIFHYRHHHRHDQKVAHMDFRARGITY